MGPSERIRLDQRSLAKIRRYYRGGVAPAGDDYSAQQTAPRASQYRGLRKTAETVRHPFSRHDHAETMPDGLFAEFETAVEAYGRDDEALGS